MEYEGSVLETRYTREGNGIENRLTIRECQWFCKMNPRCFYFTYHPSECVLLRHIIGTKPAIDSVGKRFPVVSGMKWCDQITSGNFSAKISNADQVDGVVIGGKLANCTANAGKLSCKVPEVSIQYFQAKLKEANCSVRAACSSPGWRDCH